MPIKICKRLYHAGSLILEKALRWCISPYLRASMLRLLGATIGNNVRVYEVKLFNLMDGFRNLIIEDDVHIGTDTLIDLTDKVIIRKGAVISPRVTILTHSNAGEYHNSPLCKYFPTKTGAVDIGNYAWIGTNVTILLGSKIGTCSVIGANSLVTHDVPDYRVAYGSPAKAIKEIGSDIEKV